MSDDVTAELVHPDGTIIARWRGADMTLTYGGPGGAFHLGAEIVVPPWILRSRTGPSGEWRVIAREDHPRIAHESPAEFFEELARRVDGAY